MVKFSKELEAQLIPEWKEAFVNYWQLKKQIKRIKLSKIPKQNLNHAEGGGSIFNSLCFLVKKISIKLSPESDHDNTNIIKVLYKLRFFLLLRNINFWYVQNVMHTVKAWCGYCVCLFSLLYCVT